MGYQDVAEVGALLEQLLPSGVAAEVASLDAAVDHTEELWPVEQQAIASAVDHRRREFALGRWCARRSLERLGVSAVAIPVDPSRRPLWPAGYVGSISHSRRLAAAAAAPETSCRSLGIDIEPSGSVTPDVSGQILTEAEQRAWADAAGFDLATLIFSIKEATYKATNPVTGQWLGFHDVEVTVDRSRADEGSGAFQVAVRLGVDHDLAGQTLHGRFGTALGHVVTAVALT